MPELARFYGITVVMFYDDHPPPHFHVNYAEHFAKIDIESGEVLDGTLPRTALRLVEEWRKLRQHELAQVWVDVRAGKRPVKIRGLD
ncbi:MAG: DUF4160 domain-containing protein [Hyphomicrobiales bacterium]|nr:DUF4160 domain-containing protein [Hyphomicrobiales bacterium]